MDSPNGKSSSGTMGRAHGLFLLWESTLLYRPRLCGTRAASCLHSAGKEGASLERKELRITFLPSQQGLTPCQCWRKGGELWD